MRSWILVALVTVVFLVGWSEAVRKKAEPKKEEGKEGKEEVQKKGRKGNEEKKGKTPPKGKGKKQETKKEEEKKIEVRGAKKTKKETAEEPKKVEGKKKEEPKVEGKKKEEPKEEGKKKEKNAEAAKTERRQPKEKAGGKQNKKITVQRVKRETAEVVVESPIEDEEIHVNGAIIPDEEVVPVPVAKEVESAESSESEANIPSGHRHAAGEQSAESSSESHSAESGVKHEKAFDF